MTPLLAWALVGPLVLTLLLIVAAGLGKWLKASRRRTQREIAAEAFDPKPPPKAFRTVHGRRISPL